MSAMAAASGASNCCYSAVAVEDCHAYATLPLRAHRKATSRHTRVRRKDGLKIKTVTGEVDSITTGGMESFSADDALKLAKGMIRRDAMTPSNGMNRRIVFAVSMRGRNDDEAKSALHVHAVLGLPTIRVAACS
jgi:hypothetical protein